jgi:microspherule protein 1
VQRNFQHAGKPNSLSAKELPSNKKGSVVSVVAHRDLENPGQLLASSQMVRLQAMPEPGPVHPVGDHSLKLELPSSDSTRRSAGFAFGGSTQFNSADTKMETLVPTKLKEETTETPMAKHMSNESADSLLEKPSLVSDFFTYPQTNVSAIKQVEDAPDRVQNHQVSHVKVGSSDFASSELVVNHSVSDPAEPSIQSDDDVPYFSDIEAMVTVYCIQTDGDYPVSFDNFSFFLNIYFVIPLVIRYLIWTWIQKTRIYIAARKVKYILLRN